MDSREGWAGLGAENPMRYEQQLELAAASIGPLRRALAAIAERLLERKAYERLGYARLSDYARERPGVSARQLQELARVDRALRGLPRLEAALLANALPWSKVRLLARVAVAADESGWIARATRLTVRALEAQVRGLASSGEALVAEPTASIALRCAPSVRRKWEEVRELAEQVAGERLSSGDALEAVLAEASSALSIEAVSESEAPAPSAAIAPACEVGTAGEEGEEGEVREEGEEGEGAVPRSIEDALPSIEQLTQGLADADAFALDQRLLRAVRLEQSLDAVLAPLLRRVAAPEHEWDHGYRHIVEYGRDTLGLSATKTRTLVRLDRAASFIPALRDAHERGALSWAKAQCLLPLLMMDVGSGEADWRSAWVAWAERVTVRRLEQDVRLMQQLRCLDSQAFGDCLERPEQTASQPMCAHPQEPTTDLEASEHLRWRVPRDVALLYADVTATLRSRLSRAAAPAVTDGDLLDGILNHARSTWSRLDPKARRPDPVVERDAYRCTVPGCTSRKNLHDHHIVFRSAGGSDEEENRTTLCAFHHQRGVHGGWLRIKGRAPDRLVFELGVRETGPPLARYASGDVQTA